MSMLSSKSPRLDESFRPSQDETERYAHVILAHEGRPVSSLADCRREAELQLWADRSFRPRQPRTEGRRSRSTG
jgi:hypothetical protein